MTLLEKLTLGVLILTILATGCFAASLTHVSGSITLSFGEQPVNQIAVALSEMRATR